jgi:hypothetical protein
MIARASADTQSLQRSLSGNICTRSIWHSAPSQGIESVGRGRKSAEPEVAPDKVLLRELEEELLGPDWLEVGWPAP